MTTKVTIKAASIDTRNAQRDEHLRSNDFLAMDTYPEISLTYEGAATDPFGNLRIGFEGSVTINRKDYGVTWDAAPETGGVLVSDKIVLEFEVSASKTPEQAPTATTATPRGRRGGHQTMPTRALPEGHSMTTTLLTPQVDIRREDERFKTKHLLVDSKHE